MTPRTLAYRAISITLGVFAALSLFVAITYLLGDTTDSEGNPDTSGDTGTILFALFFAAVFALLTWLAWHESNMTPGQVRKRKEANKAQRDADEYRITQLQAQIDTNRRQYGANDHLDGPWWWPGTSSPLNRMNKEHAKEIRRLKRNR